MKAGKRALNWLSAIPTLCCPRCTAVEQAASHNASLQLQHLVHKGPVDRNLNPCQVSRASKDGKPGRIKGRDRAVL
jgi:hypothetical protein